MTDPLDTFLGILGAIQEAAWRGYGSRDLAVSLYLQKPRRPDEEAQFAVRLIAMDTPKDVRLYRQMEFNANLLRQLRATPDALQALLAGIEHMGHTMTETQASGVPR